MDILLYYDIFEKYLSNKSTQVDQDSNVLIWNIINNKNNKILYSDKYFDFTIEYLNANNKSEYVNELYPLINNLYDNERLKPISNRNGEDMEQEFLQLYKNHKENILITFIVNYKSSLLSIKDRLTVLDQSIPVNKDWIYLNLAATGKVFIKPDNFTTIPEIKNFFKHIYEIPKIISCVNIFSDFYNFSLNDCFKYLSDNRLNVCYYSKAQNKVNGRWRDFTLAEVENNKRQLQSKFPNRFKYYTTDNKTITHKRRIAFENIIIYVDIDFHQIKPSNNNWVITIEYSETEYNKLLHTLREYTLM